MICSSYPTPPAGIGSCFSEERGCPHISKPLNEHMLDVGKIPVSEEGNILLVK
jgi:hypothetical protein